MASQKKPEKITQESSEKVKSGKKPKKCVAKTTRRRKGKNHTKSQKKTRMYAVNKLNTRRGENREKSHNDKLIDYNNNNYSYKSKRRERKCA